MASTFKLNLDRNRVSAVLEQAGGPVDEHLQVTAARLLRLTQAFCPVGSGALRDSFEMKKSGKGYVVYTRSPYAMFVIKGTSPHRISARPGGVLAWDTGAGTAFAKWVMHPGTNPNDFMLNALRLSIG
jgi:hypothetical protein